MADDDDLDEVTTGPGAANPSPGMGKLLLVSLLVSLLMSGGVGAGVYFLLKPELTAQQPGGPDEEEEEEEEEEKKPKEPPIYFSLEEPFIVNLSTRSTRFLQVSVELMARDDDVIEAVQKHRPLLRNNLLLLFSAQSPETISTPEGKEAMRRAALAEVQSVLEELNEPAGVEDLYFTSLVVQ